MKKFYFPLVLFILLNACSQTPKTVIQPWVSYDESQEIADNQTHELVRMRYKLIQSRVLDKNKIWKVVQPQIKKFSEEEYERLKPLILGQDIPTLQSHIRAGDLTYEKLTQWYLYRIVKYENDKKTMLNAIVGINPNAVKEARAKDKVYRAEKKKSGFSPDFHPVYGMPILVKDNIGTAGMPTTAGAHVLQDNVTEDAAIITNIKAHGGIILGKTNLTEWANYIFDVGPNGYSAVGGQTLNAYGRKIYDTGGSSSGSGVAMAASYAAATLGTETSGSILSPSGRSSLAGLKPTVGVLDRTGNIPLASTLDTPGPMAGWVVDNAIVMAAMTNDTQYLDIIPQADGNASETEELPFEGLRFGVNKSMLGNPLYKAQAETIAALGGVTVVFDPVSVSMQGFLTLLSGDMKEDLANYLQEYVPEHITVRSVADIVEHNNQDPDVRIPYGQEIFERMAVMELTEEELDQVRTKIQSEGKRYFETPMDQHQLDVILSIDNLEASYAAVANFPCMIVPMGYTEEGGPTGLTFIARSFEELKLLKIGYAFEQATRVRQLPQAYR